MIGILRRDFTNFDSNVLLNLCNSLVRPYCSTSMESSPKKDINLVKSVQRRMTRLIPRMKVKTYVERLNNLNLMSLEQRSIRQDLLSFYNITNKKMDKKLDGVMEIVGKERTRGNSSKIIPQFAKLESRRITYFTRI